MSGSLILAILAGCMQTHVVSFVLPQRKAAITKRSDPQKEDQHEKNRYRIGDAGAKPTPYPTGTLYAGIQRI